MFGQSAFTVHNSVPSTSPILQENDYFPVREAIQGETKSAILLGKIFTISIYLISVINLIIILLYLIWRAAAAYGSLGTN